MVMIFKVKNIPNKTETKTTIFLNHYSTIAFKYFDALAYITSQEVPTLDVKSDFSSAMLTVTLS